MNRILDNNADCVAELFYHVDDKRYEAEPASFLGGAFNSMRVHDLHCDNHGDVA